MAKSNKSKWIIGLSGAALSAFVISQVGAGQSQDPTVKDTIPSASMSKQEQELVQLDWTNYSINGAAVSGGSSEQQQQSPSDRQTRRS